MRWRIGLGAGTSTGLGLNLARLFGHTRRTQRTLQLGLDPNFGHANRRGFNCPRCPKWLGTGARLWCPKNITGAAATATRHHGPTATPTPAPAPAPASVASQGQATGHRHRGLEVSARMAASFGRGPRLQRALRVWWIIQVVLHFRGALIAAQVGLLSTPQGRGGAQVFLALGANG